MKLHLETPFQPVQVKVKHNFGSKSFQLPTRYTLLGRFEIKSKEYHWDLGVTVCGNLFLESPLRSFCNNAYATLSLFRRSISKQAVTKAFVFITNEITFALLFTCFASLPN